MASRQINPSDKQMEVFRFLIAHIQEHGYQPSIAEMAMHFGVTKRAILDRLQQMESKGFLKTGRRKDRAIELSYVKFQAIMCKPEE
ncbi:MAG: hypothetical protein K2R98_19315 [Gemmataceae bacterium]|nr:hypothetical protein [Gemmataceae bacterium]